VTSSFAVFLICDTGKIYAFDKIMFENQNKNMEIKDVFT